MKIFIVILILACLISVFILSKNTGPEDEKTARVGNNFYIELESNPTTGYGWELAGPVDEHVIRFVSSKYTPDNTGRVGSGGKEIWTFNALKQGRAAIAFNYIRPWEKGAAPANAKSYRITVK